MLININLKNMDKTYILKVERKNIGKEPGDYYNGEYGNSPEKIQELIDKGIIEEEIDPETQQIDDILMKLINVMGWDTQTRKNLYESEKAKIIQEIKDLLKAKCCTNWFGGCRHWPND